MAGLVLTDASPIIGLARVGGLSWLHQLFGKVWVPIEVHTEVIREPSAPDVGAIKAALSQGFLHVWPTPSGEKVALPDLDEGESACIQIALSQSKPTLILIDERAGRSVAQELGLRIAGTAAVIGLAKAHGLIPSAREAFRRLHASDFRISKEVIDTVLHRTGERP